MSNLAQFALLGIAVILVGCTLTAAYDWISKAVTENHEREQHIRSMGTRITPERAALRNYPPVRRSK